MKKILLVILLSGGALADDDYVDKKAFVNDQLYTISVYKWKHVKKSAYEDRISGFYLARNYSMFGSPNQGETVSGLAQRECFSLLDETAIDLSINDANLESVKSCEGQPIVATERENPVGSGIGLISPNIATMIPLIGIIYAGEPDAALARYRKLNDAGVRFAEDGTAPFVVTAFAMTANLEIFEDTQEKMAFLVNAAATHDQNQMALQRTYHIARKLYLENPTGAEVRTLYKSLLDNYYNSVPQPNQVQGFSPEKTGALLIALLFGKADIDRSIDIISILQKDDLNLHLTIAGLVGFLNGGNTLAQQIEARSPQFVKFIEQWKSANTSNKAIQAAEYAVVNYTNGKLSKDGLLWKLPNIQ